MSRDKLAKNYEKEWWHEPFVSKDWRDIYHETISEYLNKNGYEPEDLPPSVETCKILIPYLGDKID
jgi:hypothetical protein